MDYLPWSRQASRQRPRVPLLAMYSDICPSFEAFETWPQTREWDLENEVSISRLAARCQAWLYFGLLKVFLGNSFQIDLFVEDGFVHSETLPNVLKNHFKANKPFSDVGRSLLSDQDGDAIISSLATAVRIFESTVVPCLLKMDIWDSDFNVWTSERCRVLFSICLLLEYLHRFLVQASVPIGSLSRQNSIFIHQTPCVAEALRQVGRCPSLLRRLELPAHDVYFLLSFGMWEGMHGECTMDRCTLFDVDSKRYKPQHCSSCRDSACRSQGFDYKKLCEIIDRNQIPLVCSKVDRDSNVTIELQAGTLGARYTAISHVWAGGLGNSYRNALPTCQLRQIHYDVILSKSEHDPERIPSSASLRSPAIRWWVSPEFSTVYWLDALCIPVSPPENRVNHEVRVVKGKGKAPARQSRIQVRLDIGTGQKSRSKPPRRVRSISPPASANLLHPSDDEVKSTIRVPDKYRQNAINSMGRIYAGAAAVLVLDPELQTVDPACLTAFEIQLAVAVCPWMARSWTLQEGALAVRLKLVFCIKELSNESECRKTSNTTPKSKIFFMKDTISTSLRRGKILDESMVGGVWRQDLLAEAHPDTSISPQVLILNEIFWTFLGLHYGGEYRHTTTSTEYKLDRFTRVWDQLSRRSTSQPDDVAAIFASLGNLSAGEVLKLKHPQNRMKALLRSQSTLPISLLLAPTMEPEDDTGWIPKFPDYKLSTMRISGSEVEMEVTDEGFVLKKPPLLHEFPETHQSLPKVLYALIAETSTRYQITFNAGSRAECLPSCGSILLWLAELRDLNGNRQGCVLRVLRNDTDGLHVKLGATFVWKYWMYDQKLGDSPSKEEDWHRIEPLRVDASIQSESLIIDMPIKDWPDLKWSRLKAFPFVQLALGQHRLIDLLPFFCSLVFCVTPLFPVVFTLPWVNQVPEGSAERIFSTVMFAVPFMIPRLFAMFIEVGFIRTIEARWVQKNWAASFWGVTTMNSGIENNGQFLPTSNAADNSSASSGSLRRAPTLRTHAVLHQARPTFAIKALLLHIILWLLLTLALVLICSRFLPPAPEPLKSIRAEADARLAWPVRLVILYGSNRPLEVARIICLALASEMFIRVIVFAQYLNQWRVASSNTSTQARSETGLSNLHRLIRVWVWIFYILVWVMNILLLDQCAREIHEDEIDASTILGLISSVIYLILLVVGFSWRMVFALHERYRRVIGSQGRIRV
ncbi:hypothetical protein MMC22_009633 [Lobaria immixta]|nr:hypothetical protein [Lobaria immixta]